MIDKAYLSMPFLFLAAFGAFAEPASKELADRSFRIPEAGQASVCMATYVPARLRSAPEAIPSGSELPTHSALALLEAPPLAVGTEEEPYVVYKVKDLATGRIGYVSSLESGRVALDMGGNLLIESEIVRPTPFDSYESNPLWLVSPQDAPAYRLFRDEAEADDHYWGLKDARWEDADGDGLRELTAVVATRPLHRAFFSESVRWIAIGDKGAETLFEFSSGGGDETSEDQAFVRTPKESLGRTGVLEVVRQEKFFLEGSFRLPDRWRNPLPYRVETYRRSGRRWSLESGRPLAFLNAPSGLFSESPDSASFYSGEGDWTAPFPAGTALDSVDQAASERGGPIWYFVRIGSIHGWLPESRVDTVEP